MLGSATHCGSYSDCRAVVGTTNERLLNALATGENRPHAEGDRLHARKAGRWREQMTGLWQRIAGMTMERPGRLQPHRPDGAGSHTTFPSHREHNWRAVPDAISCRTRDAILGPSVRVVGLGLTPREYEGRHVGTHER